MKQVSFQEPAQPDRVGTFTIARALPNRAVNAVGPFLLLDHLPRREIAAGELPEPDGSFAHPHRGIVTFTYVMEGAMTHFDSLGNNSTVTAGPSSAFIGFAGHQPLRDIVTILHEERLKDIILDEAYRGIAVREGDRNVTLPMAQAIVRAIAMNAVKGQSRSQRLFAELLAGTEDARRMLNDEWLRTAIEYKVDWDRELDRRKSLGIKGLPEPLPHPDHIEIDFVEGTARIVGPRTKEEKAEFDALIEQKPLLLEEMRDTYQELQAATDAKARRKLNKELDEQIEVMGFINKLAPPADSETETED